ncbi:MAG TPA: hypothetical protein PK954_12870 [Anaerolineales bacterium]|nr:hypothetical protein [Anaerolineales bacterium]
MGNFHVERRLERARELAGPIARLAGVQAIVVAGSVGRGYADAYSDIEIPIFWDVLRFATILSPRSGGASSTAMTARRRKTSS